MTDELYGSIIRIGSSFNDEELETVIDLFQVSDFRYNKTTNILEIFLPNHSYKFSDFSEEKFNLLLKQFENFRIDFETKKLYK